MELGHKIDREMAGIYTPPLKPTHPFSGRAPVSDVSAVSSRNQLAKRQSVYLYPILSVDTNTENLSILFTTVTLSLIRLFKIRHLTFGYDRQQFPSMILVLS